MYDVIVVGAGPAGSLSARECARAGLTVLMLDKDAFPGQKPCAGAVSAKALSCLDFAVPDGIIDKECFGVEIKWNDRTITARKEQRIAVLVSRDRFDRFLADKAVESGVRFLPGEKVVAVSETRDSVSATTEKHSYEGRFLIGADGVHSVAARLVRPPYRKEEIALALVSTPAADNAEIDFRLPGVLAFRFGIAPLGYGWLFPHRGCFSLGVAGLASAFSDPRAALSEYGRTVRVEAGPMCGHFIPLGGIRRKIASKRILLAGDAAGFADPFHGEGIAHAFLSGKLAAGAIIDSITNHQEPSHAASRYASACERRIRKPLRVALAMARLLDRHPKLFVRIFFDNKAALEHYLEIASGRSDYRRFLRWLLVRAPFYLAASFLKEFRRTRPEDVEKKFPSSK